MPFVQVPCFIYTSPLLLSPSTVCFERSILRTSVSWIGAVKSRLLYCAPVSTIAAQLKYHRIMAGGCGHKSGQNAISSKRFAGTLCVTGFAQKLLLLLRWLLCMHCIEFTLIPLNLIPIIIGEDSGAPEGHEGRSQKAHRASC